MYYTPWEETILTAARKVRRCHDAERFVAADPDQGDGGSVALEAAIDALINTTCDDTCMTCEGAGCGDCDAEIDAEIIAAIVPSRIEQP